MLGGHKIRAEFSNYGSDKTLNGFSNIVAFILFLFGPTD